METATIVQSERFDLPHAMKLEYRHLWREEEEAQEALRVARIIYAGHRVLRIKFAVDAFDMQCAQHVKRKLTSYHL